ncbi:hypothetical protein B0T25DRAFT_58259 [Lasiosphaeria hispida]|uniref:Secreted protein n=1 Tax=Lasiosphaeria hispida TaxID=260671 RepID=A0AAJ0MKQ8_9PEZI|nr:hypothetical protein B0T25DRAFT_58259 [Lasiosphaeria hispida]
MSYSPCSCLFIFFLFLSTPGCASHCSEGWSWIVLALVFSSSFSSCWVQGASHCSEGCLGLFSLLSCSSSFSSCWVQGASHCSEGWSWIALLLVLLFIFLLGRHQIFSVSLCTCFYKYRLTFTLQVQATFTLQVQATFTLQVQAIHIFSLAFLLPCTVSSRLTFTSFLLLFSCLALFRGRLQSEVAQASAFMHIRLLTAMQFAFSRRRSFLFPFAPFASAGSHAHSCIFSLYSILFSNAHSCTLRRRSFLCFSLPILRGRLHSGHLSLIYVSASTGSHLHVFSCFLLPCASTK